MHTRQNIFFSRLEPAQDTGQSAQDTGQSAQDTGQRQVEDSI